MGRAGVAPYVDAQRLRLAATVLGSALRELLTASDTATGADRAALIEAAAVIEWLIAQCHAAAAVFHIMVEDLHAQLEADLTGDTARDQPDTDADVREMMRTARPPMPARQLSGQELAETRAALEETGQILSWSGSEFAAGARGQIRQLSDLL